MGMKIYTNELDHMTKTAAMPIYDKTFKIVSFRTNGPMELYLVCSIWYPNTTKIVQTMTLVDLDLFYGKIKYGKLLVRRIL